MPAAPWAVRSPARPAAAAGILQHAGRRDPCHAWTGRAGARREGGDETRARVQLASRVLLGVGCVCWRGGGLCSGRSVRLGCPSHGAHARKSAAHPASAARRWLLVCMRAALPVEGVEAACTLPSLGPSGGGGLCAPAAPDACSSARHVCRTCAGISWQPTLPAHPPHERAAAPRCARQLGWGGGAAAAAICNPPLVVGLPPGMGPPKSPPCECPWPPSCECPWLNILPGCLAATERVCV